MARVRLLMRNALGVLEVRGREESLTAAPGRIGTVAVTPNCQSLGTKEERRV
jgi:hypothetical protein